MKNKNKSHIIIFIILLTLIVSFFYLESIFTFDLNSFVNYIHSFGLFSPLVYILIMVLAIVVSPIPSLPLAIASGIIFGTTLGTIYSLIGAQIGAIMAFLISRKFGRRYVLEKFGNKIKFLDSIPQNHLMFYIFVFRLFPFFQFDMISYGSGLTKISLTRFSLATFFGMIPVTLLLVYMGESFILNYKISLLLVLILIILMYIVPKFIFKNKK